MAFLLHWLVLLGFWLLLSGMFDVFHVTSGIVCAGLVAGVTSSLQVFDAWPARERPIHIMALGWPRVIAYSAWLLREVVKANWDVLRIVLDPRLPIDPALIRFRTTVRSDLGVTLFANSITLTPGTITVQVGEDEFLVHALVGGAPVAVGLGEMQRRVIKALPALELPQGDEA